MQDTLFIVKPDAVSAGVVGKIVSMIEECGLKITALKMQRMSLSVAKMFYLEHQSRPFYNDLTNFMSSGPVVVCVLRGENAVSKLRELLGDTDPSKAAPGTIRALYGRSIDNNAAHASDSPNSAIREVGFFFAQKSLIS